MTIDLEEVVASHGLDDPSRYIAIADHFLQLEDRAAAAAALDRAYGLAPDDADLAHHRAAILDELAVVEHGMIWRFVPAGTFVMGSATGDPDERPVHPRRVGAFWITEVPLTWVQQCAALGWPAPPRFPEREESRDEAFVMSQRYKIRRYYCKDQDVVPVVAAGVVEGTALATRLSTATMRVGLPTEAQWEKAARGGLVGKRYAWGDDAPTPARCDFDRMGDFTLRDPRALPPNGYGVYGMCGGVSEWTADSYDALAYTNGAIAVPNDPEYVLRGGSWSDCADAITVSYRTSRAVSRAPSPTIGLRLIRETCALERDRG